MNTAASGLCMGCMSALGDRTVCPNCGYDNSSPYNKKYKKPGSSLGNRYIVGRIQRKNGEGATYIGYDNNLQCRVWIKEYFPSTMAERNLLTGDVSPLEGYGAQYKAFFSDFVDVCTEVKRLSITEPVIPIENVVYECGTVYAIYKDMDVMSFESYLAHVGGKLSVKETREMLLPLLNALSNIHARSGDIHRGISPFTVYVDQAGQLYLWDFCMDATRTGGSELEAELFNGYSAPEQYSSNGWQGTWTDVYGVAALFYRAVSGFVPPKSTLIGPQRPLAPLIDLVMDMPKNISDAVAEAMRPAIEGRTQEIGSFTSSLIHTDLSSTAIYDVSKVTKVKKEREAERAMEDEKRQGRKYMALGLLFTVIVLAVILWVTMTALFPGLVGGGQRPNNRNPESSAVLPDEAESSEDEDAGTMPDLVGKTKDEVMAGYQERFTLDIREDYSDKQDEGVVYDQSPSAGVKITDGRTVILYVSKGKRDVIMPDLVGMSREDAEKALTQLTAGEFDLPYNEYSRYDPDAEPGTVISTTPAAGTKFDPRSTTLYIIFMPEEESSAEESSQVSSQASQSSQASSQASQSSRPKESSQSSRMTVEEFERQRQSRQERDRDR